MPRSSDSGPGCAPGHVDEGDDGQPEALRELHRPHRLAIALGMRHAEVAPDVLLGVGALLLADDHDSMTVDPGEAAPSPRRRRRPVAVELDELVGHLGEKLERPRTAEVARQLDAVPHVGLGVLGRPGPAVGRRPSRRSTTVLLPVRGARGRRRFVGGDLDRSGRWLVRRRQVWNDTVGQRGQEPDRVEQDLPPSETGRCSREPGSAAAPRARRAARAGRRRGRRIRARTGTPSAGSPAAAPGRSCPRDTRAPANPISAFGSAMLTSPRTA